MKNITWLAIGTAMLGGAIACGIKTHDLMQKDNEYRAQLKQDNEAAEQVYMDYYNSVKDQPITYETQAELSRLYAEAHQQYEDVYNVDSWIIGTVMLALPGLAADLSVAHSMLFEGYGILEDVSE